MNSNNNNLIVELRKEAAKLVKAADALTKAADALEGKESISEPVQPMFVKPAAVGSTRLEQLANLIKIHGAMTTRQIIEAGSIPKGTATSLMTDANGFVRDQHGRWKLKEKNTNS